MLLFSVGALWYHALAGIRHLIWDTDCGLHLTSVYRLGWAAIIGSVVLTLLTVLFV